MVKQLVVNVVPGETRVALQDKGRLVELFVERGEEGNMAGSIHKGRVQRILPGMQAAFVDIGQEHAAFLYVDDVGEDRKTGPMEKNPPKIEDLIREGQDLMVQITKAPVGTKGARVTCHISLPGRVLVYMPGVDHIGVSRRIESDVERARLKALVLAHRKPGQGCIFRTASEGVAEEVVIRELDELEAHWQQLVYGFENQKAPSCLHRDLTAGLRAIRDLLVEDDTDAIIVDDRTLYGEIRRFLSRNMPDFAVKVAYHDSPEPIFATYNLESELERALRKKVWLKSGGYLIIEQTEALCAIDVNTGRFVGKKDFEETLLKTNLEASREVARQVRLRNLCGLIIIDYIDMERSMNREKVHQELVAALKADRTRSHVLPMSEMGLIQMTRKRGRKPIAKMLLSPCRTCGGSGAVLSTDTLCHQIYRELVQYAQDVDGDGFEVRCHADVVRAFGTEHKGLLAHAEGRLGCPVRLKSEVSCSPEHFDIVEKLRVP